MRARVTSSVHSVERALAILELLDGSKRRWNISDISRRLNIPKSTAHTLVLTLERLGYLNQEVGARSFGLGLKAYCLGQGMIRSVSLNELALPRMQWAAMTTHLTVHLAVLDKDQAVYVQKVEASGVQGFDTYVGKRTNLHCTAIGKVLLAYAKPDGLRRFLAKTSFARYTANTITSKEALSEELRNVRARGYGSEDREEELDTACLAVPIFDLTKTAVAALGVTATPRCLPAEKYDTVAAILRKAASNIFRASAPPSGPPPRFPQPQNESGPASRTVLLDR
jgi:DNA-binding IclR family transcriptional regulator